ncbi:hypothetical protein E2P81_ATG08348 [Venturia nashicola]|nr:hypothetical protein E2P81_ATG08348 [Venturia nashicola]
MKTHLFVNLLLAGIAVSDNIGFEDLTDVSPLTNSGITGTSLPDIYNGFHFEGMKLAVANPLGQPLTPVGKRFALGFNASSITTKFVGQTLRSFNPLSAAFGLFLATQQGETPAVNGTIRVTPSAGSSPVLKTFDPAYVDCPFKPTTLSTNTITCLTPGCGLVQTCQFPRTWREVEKLRFLIFPSLPPVTNSIPIPLPVGEQLLAFDDFNYTPTTLLPGERC